MVYSKGYQVKISGTPVDKLSANSHMVRKYMAKALPDYMKFGCAFMQMSFSVKRYNTYRSKVYN